MGNKLVKVGSSLHVRPNDVVSVLKGRGDRTQIVLRDGKEWLVTATVADVVKALNDAQ